MGRMLEHIGDFLSHHLGNLLLDQSLFQSGHGVQVEHGGHFGVGAVGVIHFERIQRVQQRQPVEKFLQGVQLGVGEKLVHAVVGKALRGWSGGAREHRGQTQHLGTTEVAQRRVGCSRMGKNARMCFRLDVLVDGRTSRIQVGGNRRDAAGVGKRVVHIHLLGRLELFDPRQGVFLLNQRIHRIGLVKVHVHGDHIEGKDVFVIGEERRRSLWAPPFHGQRRVMEGGKRMAEDVKI